MYTAKRSGILTETKKCNRCGAVFPSDQFPKSGKSRNGTQKYKPYCYRCQREITRVRYQTQKARLDAQRTACCKCGETRSYVLDFHHYDPATKKFTIGRAPLRSAKQMDEEVKKCVVLCANCHREFHWLAQHEGMTLEEYLGT